MGDPDLAAAFLEAACVPLDGSHGSGTLERAEEILAAHPAVATADIYAAAVLGDAANVRRFLDRDASLATAPGGPRGWDALTHLCFSRYLRLGGERGFVPAAEALLDAGASPGTGFYEPNHQPEPTFESVLYGAAGIAHHAELTRLLLDRGADPNDAEVPYHAPEGTDSRAMMAVVESGRLAADGLTTMLHRKLDWHDRDGVRRLLDHGVDPNAVSHWGDRALHHALARDNDAAIVELLLAHGADPTLVAPRAGLSASSLADQLGRADVLALFDR